MALSSPATPHVALISGVAHMSDTLRRQMGWLRHGREQPTPLDLIADDNTKVDVLTRCLQALLQKHSRDGHCNVRDVAAELIGIMEKNQR